MPRSFSLGSESEEGGDGTEREEGEEGADADNEDDDDPPGLQREKSAGTQLQDYHQTPLDGRVKPNTRALPVPAGGIPQPEVAPACASDRQATSPLSERPGSDPDAPFREDREGRDRDGAMGAGRGV